MFALDSLVRRGQVRYIGCSNFTSWQLNEANRIVKEHHLTPFVTLQQQDSLLCRTIEWDTIDVLEKDNVGILPCKTSRAQLSPARFRVQLWALDVARWYSLSPLCLCLRA